MRAEGHGERGRAWLARLDDLVAFLASRWSVIPGAVVSGGSESLVVTATCPDGQPAVLKLGLPGAADLAREGRIHELADGLGYARMIACDADHNALLLERLGAPLRRAGLSVAAEIEMICRVLERAWRVPAGVDALMTGAGKAHWLADAISRWWSEQDGPCEPATRQLAVSFCRERADAHDAARAVLVHGDAHADNLLADPLAGGDDPAPWRFVDPDGLWAEPACDLAVPMRDYNAQLLAGDVPRLARARCDAIAELTGTAPRAVWQWGFMERVSTGLAQRRLGMHAAGDATLAVADRLRHEHAPP